MFFPSEVFEIEKEGSILQRFAKTRGVKGAASWCAFAAVLYLLCKQILQALISFVMGLVVEGASLDNPVGFSVIAVDAALLIMGILSIALPVLWLLRTTRLEPDDLRLTSPPQWSPLFCIVLFLGIANLGNLFGGLLSRLFHMQGSVTTLPSSGGELVLSFLTLCVLPAVGEELLFRGALQGLMRPCGSPVAVFAPALLFALLHLNLAQGITAFVCGLFLGWLTERTGSVLPGMMLHFINNCIAFADIYLQLYAPGNAAMGIELFVLLFFPLIAAWLLWRAVTRQGFSFGAGMHTGVDAVAVFSSPAYTLVALFLAGASVYFSTIAG